MADLSEYPRFMCKPGTQEEAWGYKVDTSFAESPEHEAEMREQGWHRQPGDWDTAEKAPPDPRTDDDLRQEIGARGLKVHHKAGRAKMLEALAEK